jgi:hypothetical protein
LAVTVIRIRTNHMTYSVEIFLFPRHGFSTSG